MSTAAPTPDAVNGSAAVASGLRRFAESRENARRFHRGEIGPVDPDHCFGDFLLCVRRAREGSLEARRKLESVYKTALAESSGAQGGYAVPVEMRHDMILDVAEQAIVRPRAFVAAMSSATLQLPLPDATTAQSAGTAPFWGGMLLKWTGEGRARPESEPAFRQLELKAWDLSGYIVASMQVVADALGVDAWLRRLIASAVAYYEDLAFVAGDGVGKPQGAISAKGQVAVNRQTAGQFTLTDAGAMAAKLLPASWDRAVWLTHPTVWTQQVGIGGVTPSFQINQPTFDGDGTGRRPNGVLVGLPLYVSDKCSTLGTKGDVILADFWLYAVGDRDVLIDFSPYEPTAFAAYQGAWRIVARRDGRPWLDGPVTLQDGTSTASPFVVLN